MFSFVIPLDSNRLKQFAVTKRLYDEMPQKKEFIILTRSYDKVSKFLSENKLDKNVTLLPYEHKEGFNCSKALNIGVMNTNSRNVIITSPEVKPVSNVLEQLSDCRGANVICHVMDEAEDGSVRDVLVSSIFRSDTPAMYFLAMFNKSDIEKINGWDEDFMNGYAYEDNDFGERWRRAGLPFMVRDDIQGIHQYHPRSETIRGGMARNKLKFDENNDNGVIRCENGIIKP